MCIFSVSRTHANVIGCLTVVSATPFHMQRGHNGGGDFLCGPHNSPCVFRQVQIWGRVVVRFYSSGDVLHSNISHILDSRYVYYTEKCLLCRLIWFYYIELQTISLTWCSHSRPKRISELSFLDFSDQCRMKRFMYCCLVLRRSYSVFRLCSQSVRFNRNPI